MQKRSADHLRRNGIVVLVTMLIVISCQPAQANWCACCVEAGQRYEETGEIYDHEFEIINGLKVYRVARRYLKADGFKGMSPSDSLSEDYAVSVSQNARRWTFSFKSLEGKRGSLIFTLPRTGTRFGADLNPDLRMPSRDPGSIYKEIRFKGPVWGTGMFAVGNARGTRFALVLQGKGNACMDPRDFKNWSLAIDGPRASYSFYGAFDAVR